MTWTQLAHLWNDYGAFVAICVVVATALVVGLSLLVKFWPLLTKSVTIGNALATLPTELGSLHADVTTLQGHVTDLTTNLGDVTRNLGDVTMNLGDVTTKLASNGQAFVEHLDDAKVKTGILMGLDSRLDSIEDKAGTAAHQTTNNGGSSMKDAVDRSEARLKRVETALSSIANQLGHANDVNLSATGTITLSPDGAPTEH